LKKSSETVIEKAAELLRNSLSIVAFTGAGVSTESGIPDFRSAKGIFRDLEKKSEASPEEFLSYRYFLKNPGAFYTYYRKNLIHRDARPNDCHKALAALEKAGRLKAVITQNIDNLHQLAGNNTVIELHGNVGQCYCLQCRKRFGLEYILNPSVKVPRCEECGGLIKPDVIMYEERLDNEKIESAMHAISSAGALLVIGTSLLVHPAAGLIRHFRGHRFIIINKSPTQYDEAADIVIRESAGRTMKMLVTLLDIPLPPDDQMKQQIDK